MKKNKKIFILTSLLLVMVVAVTFVVTNIGAWLTDTETTGDLEITVGEVSYEIGYTNFLETGLVVPGQELVNTPMTLKNTSNVDSNVRIKIEITHDNQTHSNVDSLTGELVTMELGSNWTELVDGYYYLENSDEEEGTIAPGEHENGTEIITSLILNGSKVGNDFRGTVFTITVTFQAKQAEHLDWSETGSLNFETGLE